MLISACIIKDYYKIYIFMSKQGCKIELDGNIICSKPLMLTDSLSVVREQIKGRIPNPFVFLDQENNVVYKEDEKDMKISEIIKGKIIKLKSDTESGNANNFSTTSSTNDSNINVFEGNNKICTINVNIKNKLEQIRKLINDKIQTDFIFQDAGNDVERSDENDFPVEDILQDGVIKIKLKNAQIQKTK